MRQSSLAGLVAGAATLGSCYDTTLAWNTATIKENRTIDDIYRAALKSSDGVVTAWHGGSQQHQQDALKQAFETRFPGMVLNITVKSSDHLAPDIDRQLATGGVYVDNVLFQTFQYYPRWKREGALLNYQPAGFDHVYDAFKDSDGAWVSSTTNAWSIIYNEDKLDGTAAPRVFSDFLKPELKDKIAIIYPNSDDAILHTFDLIMNEYGLDFFESLQRQNPLWLPHSASVPDVLAQPNTSYAATFGTTIGLFSQGPLKVRWPTSGARFTSWAQRAAILSDAPNPEGAKLLQSYIISEEYQSSTGSWPVRGDVPSPRGLPSLFDTPNTNPLEFMDWMMDRGPVERLRFWFEDKLGPPV